MKVGIVTFFNVRNYGAMLQAYALWKYLAQRGHSVAFLNYPWANSMDPGFPRRLIDRHLHIHRDALEQYYGHRITKFSQYLPATQPVTTVDQMTAAAKDLDFAIVGSDQMWNPNWTPQERFPLVFLDFTDKDTRRLAYAVSVGENSWTRSDADVVGTLLKKFSAISVREQSAVPLIKKLSGMDAVCMPDPTLLHAKSFYQSLFEPEVKEKSDYVFTYFLRHSADQGSCDACVDICCKTLGIRKTLSDRQLPREISAKLLCLLMGAHPQTALPTWLARIANSRFVITNSFHGTVFSLIFHRPFIAIMVDGKLSGMNERITSLLDSVGLRDRMAYATETKKIATLARQPVDWQSVDNRIATLRTKADQFFKEQGL